VKGRQLAPPPRAVFKTRAMWADRAEAKVFLLGFRKLARASTGNWPTNPNVADRTKPTDGVVRASLAPLGRPRGRETATISRIKRSSENWRHSHIPVAKREMVKLSIPQNVEGDQIANSIE
ncbi:hypothetical protein, partial [Rhizobium sp. L43]|uniref:hypothetical protein n=1 Tax=Rhizobium sp. L43 TaxID=2035452 RepID=UPI000BEB9B51